MKVINGAVKSFNKKRSEMFPSQKSSMLKSKASSIYRELIEEGCNPNDIISLSTQLISFVTTDLKSKK
jgi:hypothetical protein